MLSLMVALPHTAFWRCEIFLTTAKCVGGRLNNTPELTDPDNRFG